MSESNARSMLRRGAVTLLNTLAAEIGLATVPLQLKTASGKQFEKLVRLLQPRCREAPVLARLRAAAEQWVNNGGKLSSPLTPAPLMNPPEEPTRAEPAEQGALEGLPNADEDEEVALPCVAFHNVLLPGYRLRSSAFLLTYNSCQWTPAAWTTFRPWVRGIRCKYGARAWSACLEESLHAVGSRTLPAQAPTKVYHLHCYLYWTDGVGIDRRSLDDFVFEGVRPRVDACKPSKRNPLPVAAAHGLWYVAVDKLGTIAAASNFHAWRDYTPKPAWLESLWEARKLSTAQFAALSRQFGSGHAGRKHDVAEVSRDEREMAVIAHVSREMAALKASGALQTARQLPEVDAFVGLFSGPPKLRRPMLAIIGGTNLGKSVLAADVLLKVGAVLGLHEFLEITVEGDAHLDLSDLDVVRHSGVLLDGVGDVAFLKKNREVLQGRPKVCKGGKSATMMYAYPYTLCRRAVVSTFDLTAVNLGLFRSDHWLSDPRNVIQLHLTAPAWGAGSGDEADAAQTTPQELMSSWTVAQLGGFLEGADLLGPASLFRNNGVTGADLLGMSEAELQRDLGMTAFAARKVARCRDEFLHQAQ